MKHDPIQQFVQLRQSLLQEKATLQARLARIEQALASSDSLTASDEAPASGKRTISAADHLPMAASLAVFAV